MCVKLSYYQIRFHIFLELSRFADAYHCLVTPLHEDIEYRPQKERGKVDQLDLGSEKTNTIVVKKLQKQDVGKLQY